MFPEIDFSELVDEEEGVQDYDEGNYTFNLNYETGEISRELITGVESVEQFALLAMRTPRFEHAIYSDQFGSEILAVVKEQSDVTPAFLSSELERVVTEAIIYDDRVSDVTDFEMTIQDNNAYISFKIIVMGDIIDIEEVLELDV